MGQTHRINEDDGFLRFHLSPASFLLVSLGQKPFGVANGNDVSLLGVREYAADSEPDSCSMIALPVFPAPDGGSGTHYARAFAHLDRLHAIDGHGQAYILGYHQGRCRILLEKVGNFRADDKNARFLQNGLQLTQRADQSLAESHLSQSIARWSIRDSVEQEGI